MIPVHQTIFPIEGDELRGNCFASCLASVLEMPLDKVPHVMMHPDWMDRTNAWLAQFGLGVIEVRISTEEQYLSRIPVGCLMILSGNTTRHPTRLHAVIGKSLSGGITWEYLHDPYPDGGFLTEVKEIMWFVVLDPARFAQTGLKLAVS